MSPFRRRSMIDPNKFMDDDRMENAPQEEVKHARLIRAITSVVTIAALGWFFWFITTL